MKPQRHRLVLILAVALFVWAPSAKAEVMYAISAASDELLRIDLSDASTTVVGLLGVNVIGSGMDFNRVPVPRGGGGFYAPGTLFLEDAGTDTLYTVSLITGALTTIGPTGGSVEESLAFVGATLYDTDSIGTARINTVSTETGVQTFLTNTDRVLDGLSATPVAQNVEGIGNVPAGTMFGVDNGALYIVDLGSGAQTLIGNVGAAAANETIAFAPNGTLYGLGNGSELHRISLDVIGSTMIGTVPRLNLWGSAIIPAPGGLALLAAAGLVGSRRRRR
jgi:hypothetical protein